ncbi:hypothetical protein HNW13_017860 [Shewanella sp. BF02_Schw]|uniref:outer membrane protein assembly factor BamE n=1 Tax=Shewanella sp. BF02_Schw TaxID=394908 RepID=UPI00177EDAC7|nr:outer membrane protein assembly factor BamE [Shewanella sp. BF02_Schw]MBO1897605.1 hypothetical protein [Shewanella sp. BF02_Schw]
MKNLIIILTITLLAACASTKINYAQEASKIELGMTKQQVISLLGTPKKTSLRKRNDSVVEEMSYWSEKSIGFSTFDNEMMADDRVMVVVVDGKVTEYGDLIMNMNRAMEKAMDNNLKMMKAMPQPEVKVTVESN